MNKEIAKLRFESADRDYEKGALVLTEDGFVSFQADDVFSSKLAQDERDAVALSRKISVKVAFGLIVLGAAAAAIGWMIGRIEGAARLKLAEPRTPDEVDVAIEPDGSVKAVLSSIPPKRYTYRWKPGEIDPGEASRFVELLNRFRAAPRGR
jgi:hypothetical protein